MSVQKKQTHTYLSIFCKQILILNLWYCCSIVSATQYFVASDGNDLNPGTIDRPLKLVQTAVSKVNPGDTIILRGGIYRETVDISNLSGLEDKPISIVGYQNEKVVFDGREPVTGLWEKYRGNIYKISLSDNVEQLFANDQMMTEARWPNAKFSERWDRKKWAQSDVGSSHGKLISSDFKNTDVDWNGAYAVLNINHQWHTWIRPVIDYDKDTLSFSYDKQLPELDATFAKRVSWYWDDFFYLFGKLEALDDEEEWFYDKDEKTLYFYPPSDMGDISKRMVSYKKRDYGFYGTNIHYVTIQNVQFFGCTVNFQNSSFVTIDACRIRYPNHSRFIKELEGSFCHTPDRTVGTKIHGNFNKLINSSLAYSNTFGVYMKGSGNLIENCVIHDINYYGTLCYDGIHITDFGVNYADKSYELTNTITRNTIYNVGNVAIEHRGTAREITYNHIFNGGLTSRDISLVYTASPSYFTNTIAYNWVHGSTQIGIRADNEVFNLSTHHNVVWDCVEGIYIKGDRNEIYNNTCLVDEDIPMLGKISITISMYPLHFSEWQKKVWDFHAEQEGTRENKNTLCFNNICYALRNVTDDIKPTDKIQNNIILSQPDIDPNALFVNLEQLDIRPPKGSILVDKGITMEKNIKYHGSKPDIGAYEYDGEFWVPGADWLDNGANPPRTLLEARNLAIKELGYDASKIWWKRDLAKLKELENSTHK